LRQNKFFDDTSQVGCFAIAFRSRASKGIYAEVAFNLSVYGENYDDIVGVVNLKNIFAHFENENFNLSDIIEKLL
jgi:Mg2+/Co2+ transporter CorB